MSLHDEDPRIRGLRARVLIIIPPGACIHIYRCVVIYIYLELHGEGPRLENASASWRCSPCLGGID